MLLSIIIYIFDYMKRKMNTNIPLQKIKKHNIKNENHNLVQEKNTNNVNIISNFNHSKSSSFRDVSLINGKESPFNSEGFQILHL